ncbi:25910_t:CDS:2 [Dentiscutata erythropus]|uniref:25910_t:CDS:1 n=1 Tax=Dentiscutata erythropus TaxID=1348616 RepID=A0A9N9H443_9GLOM|nr:25910_t:CDS:2 [Dentiscutata erythropus]
MASSEISLINKQAIFQLHGCMTVSTTSRQLFPPSSNQPHNQQLQSSSSSSSFKPIYHNAIAQKQAFNEIERLKKELDELNSIASIITNL